MSMFNLDRFRFQRDEKTSSHPKLKKANDEGSSGSASPVSDKENKPDSTKQDQKTGSKKSMTLDLGGDISSREKWSKIKIKDNKADPSQRSNEEEKKKLKMLQEMFPHRPREQLLELIRCTGTVDGATALCIMQYGDRGTPLKKKRSVSSEDEEKEESTSPPPKKRRASESEDSDEGKSSPSESEEDEDEDEDEDEEPSPAKQDELVLKLKRKFPHHDKEVLRVVLEEHCWNYEDTLGALRIFSEPAPEIASSSKKEACMSKPKTSIRGMPDLSRWLYKGANFSAIQKPEASKANHGESSKGTNSKIPDKKPLTNSVPEQRTGRKANEKEEKKECIVLSSDGEEDDLSDDYESGDDEPVTSEQQQEILTFIQEAPFHELTLIPGCSAKKVNKIISLRPFNSWKQLEAQFENEKLLSLDLLDGCRIVLRKHQVVRQLMSKCQGIAERMTSEVTTHIECGSTSARQPSTLNSSLKLQPYQLIGMKWLTLLHQHKVSGILADEMGLGKTIQAIAFLAHLYEKGIVGPHVIVVPSSTLDNWVRELQLWCPTLKVLIYYGSIDERKCLRREILDGQVDFNVIVCTYMSPLGNEFDRSLFRRLKLCYAIFDEAHMLKNMKSHRYRCLMDINAEHRLLLTGTPLQNNLLELMSLLNFIMPSMFSSSTNQIIRMFFSKSDEQSTYHKDRIDQAKSIIKPFILRRIKNDVLKELPPKAETVERCSMSPKQMELYTALFAKLKHSVPGEKKELCNVMMQLRKMANHPLLHRQYYTTQKLNAMSKAMLKEPTHFDADPDLIQEDMEVMSDFELHNLCLQYPSLHSYKLNNDLLLDSGKFTLLTQLLATLKEKGDRVVLFSQFTMVLDIVEVLLKHLDHRYLRLDGSTPIPERIGLIDTFNTDPEVFLFMLSTRAGGQGINLASANVVILHDIDCNPHNDKQAEDRCHRMGQTRPVKVIKLVSKDSIEDAMLRVSQDKLKLEECMTAADKGDENSISEDMAMLLKVSMGL